MDYRKNILSRLIYLKKITQANSDLDKYYQELNTKRMELNNIEDKLQLIDHIDMRFEQQIEDDNLEADYDKYKLEAEELFDQKILYQQKELQLIKEIKHIEEKIQTYKDYVISSSIDFRKRFSQK